MVLPLLLLLLTGQIDEKKIVESMASVLKPGGYLLILTGNAKEPVVPGPEVLTEEELQNAFKDHFDLVWIKETRFDPSPHRTDLATPPLAWCALFKKKQQDSLGSLSESS